MTTPTPKLTPAMRKALEGIRRAQDHPRDINLKFVIVWRGSNRTFKALEERGMIAKHEAKSGHVYYQLTPAGRATLEGE